MTYSVDSKTGRRIDEAAPTHKQKPDRIISNSQAEACVIDALARICGNFESHVQRDIDRLHADMKRELEVIKAECRTAIAEIKVAACQALIETRGDSQSVEKLRAVGGGRDW